MKILLVGCGIWGRKILRDLVQLDCDVSVVDPDSSARRRASEAGADNTASILPESADWDGVIVATPASVHHTSIASARRFGVPIFVEKPLTVNLAAARKLGADDHPPVFVMHTWRYHAGVERLARIAKERELGSVRMLRSTRTNWTSPRIDVDPIWTLLPHDISIALEVLGDAPRPVCAQAEMLDGRPVGMACVLSLDDIQVVVEVSTRSIHKHREISLRCEKGVASLANDRDGWVEVLRNGDEPKDVGRIPWPLEPGALYRELEVFIRYLGGAEPPKCPVETGILVVETVARLREMAGIE